MASPAAKGKIRWRDAVLFSLIAYALTWGWNAIWIIPNLGNLLTSPVTPADPVAIYGNLLNFLPGMFGPLIAAVVMRVWVSREGLRGSLGVRRHWRYYATALVAPIAFISVVAALIVLTGLRHFKTPAEPPTIAVVPLLALLLVLESVLGFGEEYGWRGYLLPRLMPLGEIPATLVLGLIWVAMASAGSDHGRHPRRKQPLVDRADPSLSRRAWSVSVHLAGRDKRVQPNGGCGVPRQQQLGGSAPADVPRPQHRTCGRRGDGHRLADRRARLVRLPAVQGQRSSGGVAKRHCYAHALGGSALPGFPL
jgi:membrane protease YdiL (CAAX protease family)